MGESQAPGGNRRVNTRDPLYRSVVLLPHPALSCGTAKCLPQMPPPLEPLVLQEPPVQMEPLVADLQPHPTPPATAGYNRHRPKSRR
ncbi:hypothetical protein F2P81_002051 [Scophthalmus maximus]|uniref:Uncharacterized protein n=1 Tax=Scophthalmus maximus TaxID=52904 RepID=A0A6A4TU46_SCOMX|nr:hypothetical protein F2P81_002051 [Scophthalmus maximus]